MNRGPGSLARRLPFFYGWVIVGCAACAIVARQGAAVAVLSVFVAPMIAEFGWSRSGLSGAVSLGGVLGALIAPALGALVDRRGARGLLVVSTLAMASTAFLLAGTQSLLWFYVAFGIGRMVFAGPFDIGSWTAVANWFVRRRARAMSYVALAGGVGLAALPFVAQIVIDAHGWRAGWVAIGAIVLIVGALPSALFMVRRPEDVGLRPDGVDNRAGSNAETGAAAPAARETAFTARAALRTPAAWTLMAFTALLYPAQAGISLHQAPYLIEQGLSPAIAATVVSTFSVMVALGSLAFGALGDRWPVRLVLALAATLVAAGAAVMHGVSGSAQAYVAAALFGAGIGGLSASLPAAWASYFGRASFGAIRGITLPVQVSSQAAGPLIAGVLYDLTGSYLVGLSTFCVFAATAALLALAARPPRPQDAVAERSRGA